MNSERTFTNCKNFRNAKKCDPWVRTAFPIPSASLKQSPPVQWNLDDVEKADQICRNCPHFENEAG
jgi:hypothetical protein